MARILLLGIISGFPWVLIGSSLTLWLTEDGLSRSTIGWAGLIFGVYAFNFLWAPLIDRVRLPWLSRWLGQRRAWILVLQAVVLLCLVLWSALDPSKSLGSVIAVGLAIAVASATQDIAIDALRIEQIGKTEGEAMAAGAAVAVVGWWSGFKLGGIVALEAAGAFQNAGVEDYWQMTFLVLGVVVVLCNIGLLFVREAAAAERAGRPGRGRGTDRRAPALVRPPGACRRLARRHGGESPDAILREERGRDCARGAGFRLPVQDRRSLHGAHVARLLHGDRLHQVRHRALLQGPGLDRHRRLYGARRARRDPHGPDPGHVRIRNRHGASRI